MNRDELRRYIRGPIGTMPTAFDDHGRVDLGVMADMARWLVSNGLNASRAPLKVAAALSEGPSLTDREWPQVLRTVVQAVGDQARVICSLKAKGLLETIEDARQAQDLGAVGLQVELPVFLHPTQDDLVRFFSDLSDAIEIGIMIYNTWWWGAAGNETSLSAASMLRLAEAEHVVAIKWDTPPWQDYDDMRQFAHLFNVIDNSGQPARCYRNGGCGFIDSTTTVFPAHALQVESLLQAERYDEAQALFDRVNGSLRAYGAGLDGRSGGYRVHKALWQVMGHRVGAPRRPILPLDEQEMAGLRDLVRSWGWPVAGAATA